LAIGSPVDGKLPVGRSIRACLKASALASFASMLPRSSAGTDNNSISARKGWPKEDMMDILPRPAAIAAPEPSSRAASKLLILIDLFTIIPLSHGERAAANRRPDFHGYS
jgi:hypothetical protein